MRRGRGPRSLALATAFGNDKIDDSGLSTRAPPPSTPGTRFNHVNEKQRKKGKRDRKREREMERDRERKKNPRNSAALAAAALDGARWRATKIPTLVAGGV